MRIIALVLITQIAISQNKFKNIQFGNTTSQETPVAPKPLRVFSDPKNSNQESITTRPLLWTNKSGDNAAAQPGAIDFSELNGQSFWARSSQKQNFNFRSANSSIYTFLSQFKTQMKIKDISKEFAFASKSVDDLGIQHIKIQQEYKGIPIYNGELIIHGQNDEMTQVNGYVFPSPIELNINPGKSASDIESIIISDLKANNKYKEVSSALLKQSNRPRYTYDLNIYHDAENKAYLSYIVSYRASGIETWVYIVDAHTGEILKKYKNTCSFLPKGNATSFIQDANHDHAAQTKTASSITHKNTFDFFPKTTSNATDLFGKTITLNTFQDGNFYLVDATRQMFKSIGTDTEEPTGVIWTFDGKNSSPAFNTFNSELINSASNTGWISPSAASAHFNAGLAYEYFLSKHNRNSINGRGGNIVSYINIVDEDKTQMDNAFWDGEAMYYGNGKDAFTSLAKSADVAGHEMSHGVIQTTANLNYESESGALNESFADIFGRLIDRDDWGMGEDVVKKAVFPTGILRSFIDPHNGGKQLGEPGYQPRVYAERYRGTEDNGGVHINSGIVNWAFYQFVTRINNNLDKAEKIYYRALTTYLTRSSRFIDCRKAVIQSATDLFGASSAEVTAAKAAYDFVGILDGAATTTQQDVQVNPGTNFIVYTNTDQNGVFLADGTGKLVSKLSDKGVLSRPSVTDDGSVIVFVGKDKKMHYIQIDWVKNQIVKDEVLQPEAIWRNVIISRQGHLLAGIKDVKENKIHVYDFAAEKWNIFALFNPTFSNGVKTGAVNYSDAMEFDHTGNQIMYDANNTIQNSAGADIEYWDISFVRVYDNARKVFGDGKISKLFGQLPEKTSVGNPTFSKNSPFIIAFDMLIEKSANNIEYLLLGGNTETGRVDTIFINGELSWPNYSNIDDRVIFNAAAQSGTKVIAQERVNNTKIEGVGTASVLISTARLGVWFANGARKISTSIENELVSKYGLKVSPNPVTDNQITVQWSQSKASEETRFYIYDIAGKIRYSNKAKFAEGNQSYLIPVNDLASGIYIMKMEIDGKSGSVKFVK